VKRLAIGCMCCTLGVILYAANWLGAAVNVAQVTEWDSSKGRLAAAYSIVGHQPLVLGVILFIVGALVLVQYLLSSLEASSETPATPSERPADDSV
jgi:hypothetical protein